MKIADTTETRKQGNSIVVTVPSSFNIKPNTVLKPKLTDKGILYEFVDDSEDFLDFDADILRNLINEGVSGDELINRFLEMKKAIPQAMNKLAQDAEKESIMSKEEFRKEVGL